jgi:hypothetical protein
MEKGERKQTCLFSNILLPFYNLKEKLCHIYFWKPSTLGYIYSSQNTPVKTNDLFLAIFTYDLLFKKQVMQNNADRYFWYSNPYYLCGIFDLIWGVTSVTLHGGLYWAYFLIPTSSALERRDRRTHIYDFVQYTYVNRDIAVGIPAGYGLDGWGVGVRVPVWERFSPLRVVQTSSGAHPASYPMGNGGCFPGGKAAGA